MSIISIVGARPNFMKMAPVISAINDISLDNLLVHTGQHYDWNMSKSFFGDLNLSLPDISMNIGSGTHAEQTSKIMIAFEKICITNNPNLVIVAGDVNSTLACSLVASKLNIPVAHIESGLRSFDRTMPEEINRILTDNISDLLFVTEKSGIENLITEGVENDKIHFVGNCMIDSVIKCLNSAKEKSPWSKYGFKGKDYCLVTMHRPSNVDNRKSLESIVNMLNVLSKKCPVIFPVHPRTRSRISECKFKIDDKVCLLEALPYLEFLGLLSNALVVITDSGGVQEETTYLGVQCITYRENTERPVTVQIGTNHLAGTNSVNVIDKFNEILSGKIKKGQIPEKWDGEAGIRIAKIINNFFS